MKKTHAGPATSPTPNREAGRGQPAINREELHRRLEARDVVVLGSVSRLASRRVGRPEPISRCRRPPAGLGRPSSLHRGPFPDLKLFRHIGIDGPVV